jgi:hypothetical protein
MELEGIINSGCRGGRARDRRWVGAVEGDEKDEPGGGDESREEETSHARRKTVEEQLA